MREWGMRCIKTYTGEGEYQLGRLLNATLIDPFARPIELKVVALFSNSL